MRCDAVELRFAGDRADLGRFAREHRGDRFRRIESDRRVDHGAEVGPEHRETDRVLPRRQRAMIVGGGVDDDLAQAQQPRRHVELARDRTRLVSGDRRPDRRIVAQKIDPEQIGSRELETHDMAGPVVQRDRHRKRRQQRAPVTLEAHRRPDAVRRRRRMRGSSRGGRGGKEISARHADRVVRGPSKSHVPRLIGRRAEPVPGGRR